MHDEDTDLASDDEIDDFDENETFSTSDRKMLENQKLDAKRKLEHYLEKRKLEKEWNVY